MYEDFNFKNKKLHSHHINYTQTHCTDKSKRRLLIMRSSAHLLPQALISLPSTLCCSHHIPAAVDRLQLPRKELTPGHRAKQENPSIRRLGSDNHYGDQEEGPVRLYSPASSSSYNYQHLFTFSTVSGYAVQGEYRTIKSNRQSVRVNIDAVEQDI